MKLCILAAGKGSRNSFSKILPKGFLPVDNQPGITHLIDSFSDIEEITIAIGSRGDIYRQFLPMIYPDVKINFVNIKNYDGPGSGPGASLLECEKYLNNEFVLIPTDAYISETILDDWNKNWMGVSNVDSTRLYCLLETDEEDEITQIYDKDPDAPLNTLKNGFNGIAFIKDYNIFFDSLKQNKNLISGEIQVSNGFMGLISNNGPGLKAKRIDTWHDFGSNEQYDNLIQKFDNQNLIKNDEFTYIHKDKVYKYNIDEKNIKNKILRAESLKKYVPSINKKSNNFFTYDYVKGDLLNEVLNKDIFLQFLNFCQTDLFDVIHLNQSETLEFRNSCQLFYKDKTKKRLEDFWTKTKISDSKRKINGQTCKSVSDLLKKIDWDYLSEGIPYNFHGDLQPENIIYNNKKFILIDWRDTFGTSKKVGDIYYDLAKLDHALLVSGSIVRANLYNIQESEDEVILHFKQENNLVEFQSIFNKFISENNYDLFKVKLLTSLIYLNIASLYEGKYSTFLYFLGQLKLNELIFENKK